MKKIKILKFLALCLPLTLLTACFPSGELLGEDGENVSGQINSIVSENDRLDMEIGSLPDENISRLPTVKVKIMEWGENKVKKEFLDGQADVFLNDEAPSDRFPNETAYYYTDKKGYSLVYDPGRISVNYYSSSTFGYGTLSINARTYRFDDFFTDDSISLLSKDEAIKRCTDIMENIGLTNYSEPIVYAITKDKANQYWHDKMYDEYEEYADWTSEEEEIYVMRFPIEYNEIPVTMTLGSDVETYGRVVLFSGSYVDFVVTKDDVYSLESWNVFSPEFETGETVDIGCSAENALKIAMEYYDSLTASGLTCKVFDCKLVYVPREMYDDKYFTLVPMWEAKAACYRDGASMGTYDELFIDAQSGSVVNW